MKKILITGGAGFIGSNAAEYFFKKNWKIYILDNLSRKGSESNLNRLKKSIKVIFVKCDIRNFKNLSKVIKKINPHAIIHAAGQVAVTTSFINPREDFEINALGTFNLLESIRINKLKPVVIYTSTNKVYGNLDSKKVRVIKKRYTYKDNTKGIDEERKTDFHSPYGCSKGAADQYMSDYHRMYNIDTYVVRQSCIYGTNQFGIEDQGWLAWFVIASIIGKKITIFGDGKQVRDLLYIDDLNRLFEALINNRKKKVERVYNAGGGYSNSLSILELLDMLEKIIGKKIKVKFSKWRMGDQKIYISNNSKLKKNFDWSPSISPNIGVNKLVDWAYKNKITLKKILR
jgi:CDP-paratose 2-epimerase